MIIELAVIMAVITILALLAIPNFMNYTKQARLTHLTYDAALLENACERYYLDHGDWPRASDIPYTQEQVNAFAQKVYDKTGKIITLDPDGNYYDIDLKKLQKYVHINSDPRNFILQNPVGSVYILDPQTNVRLKHLDQNPKPVSEVDLTAYSKVIYVSSDGDDLLGNGTKEQPYKTIPKAFSMAIDNTCIYIVREGIYSIPNGLQSILSPDKTITYAVPSALRGKVKFSLGDTEYNRYIRMNKTNTFIGIIFTLNGGTKWPSNGRIYEYFFDSAVINLEFYNCVFDVGNVTPSEFPIYAGNSYGCTIVKLNYINCAFIPNFSAYDGYPHPISFNAYRGNFINCAHKRLNFTTDPYNLTGVTFDANYNIVSGGWLHTGTGTNPDGTQANIGVYGGKYAWELKN